MTAEKVIDNKVIILQKNAGYSLEHVICLGYEKNNRKEVRRDNKKHLARNSVCHAPNSASRIHKERIDLKNGKTQTAR